MKIKTTNYISFLLIFVFVIMLFPASALAVDGTISADGTYDISQYGNDSAVTINSGLTVTLTNTGHQTYSNLKIDCREGVTLTIDGLHIDNAQYNRSCALSFTGAGNTLTLLGDSTLSSGSYEPGIRVEDSTELEIKGAGSVNVTGRVGGAGIGGGYQKNGGKITITEGTVIAQGGNRGAGIGSGCGFGEYSISAGTITVTGGTITARGGKEGAGIGTGSGFAVDRITSTSISISGGTIKAFGGMNSAGIGTGYCFGLDETDSYDVTITGGNIVAQGQLQGAGIGGGIDSSGGNIIITGGNVFAEKGSFGKNDIGHGYVFGETGGSLEISGTAAVFLRNNRCVTAVTSTHTRKPLTDVTGGMLYGIPVPEGWTSAGAYIIPYNVTYNINDGIGTPPPIQIQHLSTTATVPPCRFVTKGDQYCEGWNTQPDGSGTSYLAGDTISFIENLTLYATVWQDIKHVTSVAFDSSSAAIEHGETAPLSVTVEPTDATYPEVTWTSSNESVVSVDQSGNITGVDVGKATITATADGQNDTCNVTVNPADKGIYDISSYGDNSVIKIGTGYAVTITNTSDATYTNVQMLCQEGAELTINGVNINNSTDSDTCALGFTGGSNELILNDDSTLISGDNEPGIRAEDSTELDIKGTGSIYVTGGVNAAGIGSGDGSSAGAVTISGGYMTAQGGENGAGIGGGHQGDGGVITISGGNVFAKRGADAQYDIGDGSDSSGGALEISGEAAVFLKNDSCIAPTTAHTHMAQESVSNGKLHGVTVPGEWTSAGAYIVKCILTYDSNGSTATPPQPQIQHINTKGAISADGISRAQYVFAEWNTKADGSGTAYEPSDAFVFPQYTVLYAVWNPIPVDSVNLNKNLMTLDKGNTGELMAAVFPANAAFPDVAWMSSDESVATVDANGKVIAAGKGDAVITAAADGKSDTCAVKVEVRVEKVNIDKEAVTIDRGKTYVLTTTISPSDASYPNVTWTSSDESIATVDASGKVIAAGKGDAVITAAAEGKSDACAVRVEARVEKVNIDKEAVTIDRGKTYVLSTTISPSDASYPNVTWTSSDESIATVDASGKVIAIGKGDAVITAAADGKSDTCAVKVETTEVEQSTSPPPTETSAPTATKESAETAEIKKVNAAIVEEHKDSGEIVIEISIESLPSGTKSVRLPSGETIELDGSDTLQFTVCTEDYSEEGTISIVALNGEGVPLGVLEVKPAKDAFALTDASSAWNSIRPILIWILVGVAFIGSTGAIVYIVWRKRNPRF